MHDWAVPRDASPVSRWVEWHEQYDIPETRLANRLETVRDRLSGVLDELAVPAPRLLALCAGDARDVIPVLSARADRERAVATLVELDEVLASRARDAARTAGLAGADVRCADAGDPVSYIDVLPVDVLMMCGIFGHVAPETVDEIARRVPTMVRAGGYVIWTRGGGVVDAVDRRPEVRRAFVDAGLPEVSYDGPPETFGVGVNRVEHALELEPTPAPLFAFID